MATDIQVLIQQQAAAFGVPAAIALAVARRESAFSQSARGSAGEIGVFQLMPATAASLGVDPTDLNQNIRGGVMYLSQLYSKYADWSKALAAYNWGPGKLDAAIAAGRSIPSSVQSYVSDVLGVSTVYNAGIQTGSTTSTTGTNLPNYAPIVDYASAAGLSPQAMSLLALGGAALLAWVLS